MGHLFWRNRTRSDAILSWENEGGALAQEEMTALPMERLLVRKHTRLPSIRRSGHE
jgi:hypothetical protein